MRKPIIRSMARVMLLSLTYQLVYPNITYALTSGPTQPEVHGFEPVSTTEMVDLFTGDFVYNIPLMDVDGYPINISYHSGGNVDEEASWVGLGWSLNPGVVNRAVRGVPDDFKKDNIEKYVSIKPEKNIRAGVGVGLELGGFTIPSAGGKGVKFSASAGLYVNSSNYRGISAGVRAGLGLDMFGFASAGVNLGLGSQTGADIDYSASMHYVTASKISKEEAYGIGVTLSNGYNTRSGYKDIRISGGARMVREYELKQSKKNGSDNQDKRDNTISTNTHFASNAIPVGLQNYVPVITNRSTLTAIDVAINIGGEMFWIFPNGDISLMMSKLEFDKDGSKDAYGYLYLEEAKDSDILDFTRDKDGLFNSTMSYLPAASMTYDIYAATAQGGGGMFRPYRNDFGSVFDPKFDEPSQAENHSINLEVGLGNLFEIGGDYTGFFTHTEAGAWDAVSKSFQGKKKGSLYENVYFKQAGELTMVDEDYINSIKHLDPYDLTPGNIGSLPKYKGNSENARNPRGNLVYFFNGDDASNPEISTSASLYNYTDANGMKNGASTAKTALPRIGGTTRRSNQISEIVQLKEDGTRYVFGLPVMNNVQSEYAFSVEKGKGSTTVNDPEGLVTFDNNDNTPGNNKGIENYFSRTITPSYAHSFMLTSVLAHDYVDVTGDGITDDDFGSYTKFNYSRKEADYRWRTPYAANTAHYNAGFYSDAKDDKAYYSVGSKELWYVHSIESKNYVAEFYTSTRNDAKGSTDAALNSGSKAGAGAYSSYANTTTEASSYKLDSIVLYNKHDRFINRDNAIPVKTVIFNYTYELCPGVLNNPVADSVLGTGKLTLKKIYIRYGTSDKNLISPYQFNYSANNYAYSNAAKNRWGGYKQPTGSINDIEFPYVNQEDTNNNNYASAWQLTQIKLPSGGVINVDYESDDYAYVQNKRAMEMFRIAGVGSSTNFQPNTSELYDDPQNPYTYIYFKRRTGSELLSISDIQKLYLENANNILYYNFNVDVVGKEVFESVRGYAEVEAVGITSNPEYAYIKVAPRYPKGSDAKLSPITYTGINLARYNLPHILNPGQDPGSSSLKNVLEGLAAAASDLFNIFSNPVKVYAGRGIAKRYDISRSYIRLCHPNMKKKGGGSRVKKLQLDDSWGSMVAGQSSASYGRTYNYTIQEGNYGTISSGVASYEPSIGGDENPFKMPVSYKATGGTNFPPNDPVELFQEEPIGETLYPSPVVGYRQVEVESIHADYARSSQTIDRYEFYTAKDFPIRAKATGINIAKDEKEIKLLKSRVELEATQGYSIIMNDMHGKPKGTYNYVIRSRTEPNSRVLVSSNIYEYNTDGGGQLSNKIKGLVYEPGANEMIVKDCIVGEEIDLTIDSRHKKENTHAASLALNLNLSLVGIFPIPIPLGYSTDADHDRIFSSATTTKIVQQYGILKSVESFKEGARTKVSYEVYDPNTGIAIMTKTNNEFDDPEYSMSIPSYWENNYMGPAYENIGFEEGGASLQRLSNGQMNLYVSSIGKYTIMDELMLNYTVNNVSKQVKVWVRNTVNFPCGLIVEPRNYSDPNVIAKSTSVSDVSVRVIRSGHRNQLSSSVESYTTMDNPIGSQKLTMTPSRLLDINHVLSYGGKTTGTVGGGYSYVSPISALQNLGVPFNGIFGVYRLMGNAGYLDNRIYAGHSRRDGFFGLMYPYLTPFVLEAGGAACEPGVQYLTENNINTTNGKYWKWQNIIRRYSVWGHVLESTDKNSVRSCANYGYSNTLPTATATNAAYDEIVAEQFEDFRTLMVPGNVLSFFSPFKDASKFSYVTSVPGITPTYTFFDSVGVNGAKVTASNAHTGFRSLYTGSVEYVQKINRPRWSGLDYAPEEKLFGGGKKYIANCWMKGSGSPAIKIYKNGSLVSSITLTKKGNEVEGWYQYEGVVTIPALFNSAATSDEAKIVFPSGCYVDDVRFFPIDASMKAYVYNPFNHRLTAVLDENNYATFYEYDQEGLLVRVKKETEKGILTVQESRRSTIKTQ